MTHDLAESPFIREEVEWRERNGHDTEQDVGQCQICDEAIRHGLHGLVLQDDEHDENVTEEAHDEDHRVEDADVDLNRWTVLEEIFLLHPCRPI